MLNKNINNNYYKPTIEERTELLKGRSIESLVGLCGRNFKVSTRQAHFQELRCLQSVSQSKISARIIDRNFFTLLCRHHIRPATVGARAFVLPYPVKKTLSIRFSLPYASLRPYPRNSYWYGKSLEPES